MTYLTRIMTDATEAARHRISDNYRWHQMMWKAFPDRDKQPREFLTRVDFADHRMTVWLLSQDEPSPLSWGHWETKEVPSSFFQHDRFFFALRANPTIMRVVRNDDGSRKKNGRRTAIYDIEELKKWLIEQKAPSCGFVVEECRCEPPVKEVFVKNNQKGTHSRVDYQGILKVTNREQLTEAYQNGIGSAKAFGFGMLLLKPLS